MISLRVAISRPVTDLLYFTPPFPIPVKHSSNRFLECLRPSDMNAAIKSPESSIAIEVPGRPALENCALTTLFSGVPCGVRDARRWIESLSLYEQCESFLDTDGRDQCVDGLSYRDAARP